MEGTIELNIKEVLAALVRKLWLIVLCAVLAGGAALAYTAGFVTPLYKTSISIYVNNTSNGVQGGVISSSDLATSQRLVATYINILKSNAVLDKVAESVGNEISSTQIRNMIDSEAMGTTEVFQVYITNADPELAAEIANAIAAIAPKEIANIVEGSSARIVDYAKVPQKPYTPSFMKNTAIGALVGILAVVVGIVVQVVLDVHIKNEADLRKISDAPVLGVIPDYNLDGKKNEYATEPASSDPSGSKEV